MNETLEPREVDKPFVSRWLRASFALSLRSPFRFGILIALLGGLDTAVVSLAQGYVVEKIWADRLGILALPVLWVLVSAVARGADDNRLTIDALKQIFRRPVWIGSLSVGASLVTINLIVAFAFQGVRASVGLNHSSAYLQHQGQFLDSIEASVESMEATSFLS